MDAVLFDFDGVVADTEGIHLACFQQVLAPEGLDLTDEAYFANYVGLNDRDCLAAVYGDRGRTISARKIADLTAEKTRRVLETFARSLEPIEGSVRLIRRLAEAGTPLAVCSGALGEEIRQAAGALGVLEAFEVIVAAEDVANGKPDPEGFALALAKLADHRGRALRPERTVVIEDTPGGIAAGKSAGMGVMAVATTHDPSALTAADAVAASCAELDPDRLAALVAGH